MLPPPPAAAIGQYPDPGSGAGRAATVSLRAPVLD
jgi:hypothetical protein